MDEARLEKFEQMLLAVETEYGRITGQLEGLKAQGRTKSATYRQLMGNKMVYQNMLSLYSIYGLK